jgi:hypothetical protein
MNHKLLIKLAVTSCAAFMAVAEQAADKKPTRSACQAQPIVVASR